MEEMQILMGELNELNGSLEGRDINTIGIIELRRLRKDFEALHDLNLELQERVRFDRSIETKTKIKLQEIKGKTGDGWTNINDEYLTESQLIQLYQSKGYKVESLEDITNNGEIRYQIKLFVRNKKESK